MNMLKIQKEHVDNISGEGVMKFIILVGTPFVILAVNSISLSDLCLGVETDF